MSQTKLILKTVALIAALTVLVFDASLSIGWALPSNAPAPTTIAVWSSM